MTMTADEYLDQDIKEEFAKHRSIFRCARALGVTLDRVTQVVGEKNFQTEKRPAQYGGRGRPELEQFIVATKGADEAWDNTQPELVDCRADYEAGTHEMCQGRDGDVTIQYSIPRTRNQPRPGYFKQGNE